MEEQNVKVSGTRCKSQFFRKTAGWFGRHATVLTAVLLIAVSALLVTAELNIAYAGKAHLGYGADGSQGSVQYAPGGSGNGPTLYEPGIIGVSVTSYDLSTIGKSGLQYGADNYKGNKKAAYVASSSDPEAIDAAEKKYHKETKEGQKYPDYYPYWLKTGTSKSGKAIYKYSNNLRHVITSNILAMQTTKSYDESTLLFVPRVITSDSHHSWIMNMSSSVVVKSTKKSTKGSGAKKPIFNLTPWYKESEANDTATVLKKITSKVGSGVYYAQLKKYVRDKTKASTGKKFLELTDDGKTVQVCDYSQLAKMSEKDLDKMIGYSRSSKKFTKKGKANLAKAKSLYSSLANINEVSKGVYRTDVSCAEGILLAETAKGLHKTDFGTMMFSAYGTKEGLYGRNNGDDGKDNTNTKTIGSMVIRRLYQTDSYFQKGLASKRTEKMTELKKNVLNNEYNTHFLDLLMCGYALARQQNDTQAVKQWREQVCLFAKNSDTTSTSMKNVIIRFDTGMVYNSGKEVIYASTGNIINKYYGLDSASAFESKEGTNKKSLNKGFIGLSVYNDNSGKNYQSMNKDLTKNKGIVTQSALKKYADYYERLENAIKVSKTSKGSGWYGNMVIYRVTKNYYSYSGGKTHKKVKNKLAVVQLLKMKPSGRGAGHGNLKWQYGSYAVDGYYWKQVDEKDSSPDFNLRIYSTKANGTEPDQNGKNIKKNLSNHSLISKIENQKDFHKNFSTK